MITVGIDEVGRGCWAGPLVAGAVILPQDFVMPTTWVLGDSKQLSVAARQLADVEIRKVAQVGLGWISPAEVDELGLTEAVRLAMRRALDAIVDEYDEVVIDGNINYLASTEPRARALIKADSLVPAVSAASIIAKVARDNYMAEQARLFPQYGFDKHVGYGTARHRQALQEHGACVLHRRSYKPVQLYI